jgi:hypothetical protein
MRPADASQVREKTHSSRLVKNAAPTRTDALNAATRQLRNGTASLVTFQPCYSLTIGGQSHRGGMF